MVLFLGIIAAALVITVVIGGDIRRLSHIQVRRPELLVGAFIAKVSVALLGLVRTEGAVLAARPLNLVGSSVLLLMVWFNRRLPGARIFGLGLLLNLLVLATFGGRMPVLLSQVPSTDSPAFRLLKGGLDPLHILLPRPRGLWFLGDIFTVPTGGGHAAVISTGDILMALGVAWLIIRCSQRAADARPAYGTNPTR